MWRSQIRDILRLLITQYGNLNTLLKRQNESLTNEKKKDENNAPRNYTGSSLKKIRKTARKLICLSKKKKDVTIYSEYLNACLLMIIIFYLHKRNQNIVTLQRYRGYTLNSEYEISQELHLLAIIFYSRLDHALQKRISDCTGELVDHIFQFICDDVVHKIYVRFDKFGRIVKARLNDDVGKDQESEYTGEHEYLFDLEYASNWRGKHFLFSFCAFDTPIIFNNALRDKLIKREDLLEMNMSWAREYAMDRYVESREAMNKPCDVDELRNHLIRARLHWPPLDYDCPHRCLCDLYNSSKKQVLRPCQISLNRFQRAYWKRRELAYVTEIILVHKKVIYI